MKTAGGGWEGRRSQREGKHKRVPNPYNSFTTSQAPLRKAKITSFIENAMDGARQAGLGVRFSTVHSKSWRRISEGLFSQERIKQCSASFPASLLLVSRQYLSGYVAVIILLSPSVAWGKCGQHCPSPLCSPGQTLGACRVLTPSAGCVGLCLSALLIEVMLVLLNYHWHRCLQLHICRKNPIAQALIRVGHTLPTDKDLSYSSH